MPSFKNYPDFKPDLTPKQIFQKGSFGGTYWRPIDSGITGKSYKNKHKKYKWGLPDSKMTLPFDQYDKSINKYGVKAGTTLEFWEEKGWITKHDPYGWVQWYAEFYKGRRIPGEDERQIKRWIDITGRFKQRLISMIKKKKAKYNDPTISPKIRQTLQHWAIAIKPSDLK